MPSAAMVERGVWCHAWYNFLVFMYQVAYTRCFFFHAAWTTGRGVGQPVEPLPGPFLLRKPFSSILRLFRQLVRQERT